MCTKTKTGQLLLQTNSSDKAANTIYFNNYNIHFYQNWSPSSWENYNYYFIKQIILIIITLTLWELFGKKKHFDQSKSSLQNNRIEEAFAGGLVPTNIQGSVFPVDGSEGFLIPI